MTQKIILASASPARGMLLENAGLSFDKIPAQVDEAAIRTRLLLEKQSISPAEIAQNLSCEKAGSVSSLHPEYLVIGADQILALESRIFEKPKDLFHARDHLLQLRGKTHCLYSGVCVALRGEIIWQHTDKANLTMRSFSAEFLDHYIEISGEKLCQSVGAYQLEGRGLQLFERVEGDYFTILGLPLMPLLSFLRTQGVLLV